MVFELLDWEQHEDGRRLSRVTLSFPRCALYYQTDCRCSPGAISHVRA
jgi:hypothetical protein